MRQILLALVAAFAVTPLAAAEPFDLFTIDNSDELGNDATVVVTFVLPASTGVPLPYTTNPDLPGVKLYDDLIVTGIPATEEHITYDPNPVITAIFPTMASIDIGNQFSGYFTLRTPDFGLGGIGGVRYTLSDTDVPTFDVVDHNGVFEEAAPVGYVTVAPDPNPPPTSPVPEPATWLMAGTGLLGMSALKRSGG